MLCRGESFWGNFHPHMATLEEDHKVLPAVPITNNRGRLLTPVPCWHAMKEYAEFQGPTTHTHVTHPQMVPSLDPGPQPSPYGEFIKERCWGWGCGTWRFRRRLQRVDTVGALFTPIGERVCHVCNVRKHIFMFARLFASFRQPGRENKCKKFVHNRKLVEFFPFIMQNKWVCRGGKFPVRMVLKQKLAKINK